MYDKIIKSGGMEIELGFFADDRMSDVSAVLFSNTATICKTRALAQQGSQFTLFFSLRYNENGLYANNQIQEKKDYSESLLDGLHLFLNPFARIPFDASAFADREICIHLYDPNTKQSLPIVQDGFLFQRLCKSFHEHSEMARYADRVVTAKPMMPHNAPPWRDGELHRMNAEVFVFTDHYLAQYRGWTILVVRDSIDDDWGVQAIESLVKTIPQFIRVNRETDVRRQQGEDFYSTKEIALKEMMDEIDRLSSLTEPTA
jgi:hypothetical protein